MEPIEYQRNILPGIVRRLQEPRKFLQVLAGSRQSGKTTLALQVKERIGIPVVYASIDEPSLQGRVWIEQQWEAARLKAGQDPGRGALLILDEVQKAPGWSDTVKRLWDEDGAARRDVKVLILGSAPLLVQRGLGESLAGRFETLHVPHWSFCEMREAFGWNLDRYVFFGGYPGSAPLIADEARWTGYILESLVETAISRDVLLLSRVDKPALLRRLFYLGCEYSGQILSYQKMIGQLQDVGNTTTLAHYLDLLSGAGLLTGLQKYSGSRVRQRGSSPKFQVLNTALMSALARVPSEKARADLSFWGRLVESAVGAHLANTAAGTGIEVRYWREGNREVDFVLESGGECVAIEVKSGRPKPGLPGMEAFSRAFKPKRVLLVGGTGIPLEEFLRIPAGEWFR